MVKLKSPRSVKYAIELIGQIMDREGAIKGEQQNVSYAMAYEDDEKLIRRELIKVKG